MATPELPRPDVFAIVRELGVAWPDVQAGTKYDGSPVLTCRGCFMAGLAMHASAEPDTLVVRVDGEMRPWLLDEAADTYYVTAYYEPHPVVLVRLAHIDREALHDLLAGSRRATLLKSPRRQRRPRPAGATPESPASPSPDAPAAHGGARAPRSAASRRARCR